jgi:LPS sulfotransferase NodH
MRIYQPIDYFGGESVFKKTKESDAIKNNYFKNNGIKLIRIPYKNKEKIDSILKKEILDYVTTPVGSL